MNVKSETPTFPLPLLSPLSDLSNSSSNNNNAKILFARPANTISDFSNVEKDLEWDRHRDFNLMIESDTMSSYNLDERMAEIVKLKFLEFEIMSNVTNSHSSCFQLCNNYGEKHFSVESLNETKKRPDKLIFQRKNRASLDDSSQYFSDTQSNLFTPPNAITIDDLFDFKRLTKTFRSPQLICSLSMPDLRKCSNLKKIHLPSKHLSLLDIKYQLIYEKRNSIRVRLQTREEKSKCAWENGYYFSEKLKKIVRKVSQMFFKVFEENDYDELKASYSVASEVLTYKFGN